MLVLVLLNLVLRHFWPKVWSFKLEILEIAEWKYVGGLSWCAWPLLGQYLAWPMLGVCLEYAWHGITYSWSWNEFTFILAEFHFQYDKTNSEYDVGIIRLDDPLEINYQTCYPVCMPKQSTSNFDKWSSQQVSIISWLKNRWEDRREKLELKKLDIG